MRRVALNSAAALIAKFLSVAVTLALFPILIRYLGKSDFAIWIAVVSIAQILAWTDLGLGNSILTSVARLSRTGDALALRITVSSAYFCICVIAAVVAVGLMFAWRTPLIEAVVGRTSIDVQAARPLFAVSMIAFVLWLPSTVAGRIQTGLQMGGLANLCQAISSVAMGLLTYGAVTRGASLHTLVIIACFTPVAGHLVNTALLFLLRPQVRPSPRLIRWHASQDLLRLGVLFFTLQLGLVALTGADNLILLSRAGPAEAVDYSAVSKLFGALSSVGSILFAPLWPEYGAASARGEYEWIRRTFWRSIRLAIAIGIVGGALTLAFSSEIFQLWIGPQVRPSWTLLMFAATWAAIDLCGQCTAMMLNGLAIVRPQMIVALLFALTCLPLKWYLAYVHGAPGAYEATIICYVFAVVVPYSLYIPRLMRKGGH